MDILEAIKTVGFPIAVAAWVLIRLNGKMDKLTMAVLSLTAAMDRYIVHANTTADRSDQRDEVAVARVLDALRK